MNACAKLLLLFMTLVPPANCLAQSRDITQKKMEKSSATMKVASKRETEKSFRERKDLVISTMNTDKEQHQFAIHDYNRKTDSLETAIVRLKHKLSISQKALKQRNDSVHIMVTKQAAYDQELMSVNRSLDSFLSLNIKKVHEIEALQKKKEELEKNNNALKQEINRLNEYTTVLIEEQRTRDSLEIVQLTSQLTTYREKMEKQTEEYLIKEKNAREEINSLQTKIASLELEIKELEIQIKHLQQEVDLLKDIDRFDYVSLRAFYIGRASDDFNNPVKSPMYDTMFSYRGGMKSAFKGGLEIGSVNHFQKLWTSHLRLGLNINFSMQAMGPWSDSGANHKAASDGLYIGTLGLGPQITYKPAKFVRLGVYARLVGSMLYNHYTNTEYQSGSGGEMTRYKLELEMYNWALGYDFGIDASLRGISIGFVMEHMSATPKQNEFYTPANRNANLLANNSAQLSNPGTIAVYTPYSQPIRFDRYRILVGFAIPTSKKKAQSNNMP